MRRSNKQNILDSLEKAFDAMTSEMNHVTTLQRKFRSSEEDGQFIYHKEYFTLEDLKNKYNTMMKELDSLIYEINKFRSY